MVRASFSYHARVLEGVAKRQSPLKAVIAKSQQPCPDTVSLHLDPLLHSGVVGFRHSWWGVEGLQGEGLRIEGLRVEG